MTDASTIIECRPPRDPGPGKRSEWRKAALLPVMMGLMQGSVRWYREGDPCAFVAWTLATLTTVWLLRPILALIRFNDTRRATLDPVACSVAFSHFHVQTRWNYRRHDVIVCRAEDLSGVGLSRVLGFHDLRVRTPAGDVAVPTYFDGFAEFSQTLTSLAESSPNYDDAFRRRVERGNVLQWFFAPVLFAIMFGVMILVMGEPRPAPPRP